MYNKLYLKGVVQMDTQTFNSNLNMDYDNNKRFFDPTNARTVKKIIIAAIPFFVVALLVFMIFGHRGMFGIFGTIAIALIVVGGALMFYAISKNVKEKEVTQYLHPARKEVRAAAGELLDYPSDLEAHAELFMGAVTGDKLPEGAFPARVLKDGRKLTQELQFTYVYVRKTGLFIFTRVLSLTEEKLVDKVHEIPFADFDKAIIEPVGSGNKANLLKFMLGNTTVFEAPLFVNDYEQDEFLANIMHVRERALKG